MKWGRRVAIVAGIGVVAALPALVRGQAPATQGTAATQGTTTPQTEEARAAKAKRNAQIFEQAARVLTIFDRQGKQLATLGERSLMFQPVFSPDRTRLAIVKADLDTENTDLWVLDVATGRSTRLTKSNQGENVRSPVWSPDGSQLAYVALRGSYESLFRRPADGSGAEEALYKHAGAGMILTDWSTDSRYLSFFTTDLSGGTLYVLPLGGNGERKPIELLKTQKQVQGSRFSPDGRLMTYATNESGRAELYVRPFDPAAPTDAAATQRRSQLSEAGGQGPAFWRRDGKQIYFFAPDRSVMAVDVVAPSATSTPEFGKPKPLFRFSEAVALNGAMASISQDGERIVVALLPSPSTRQLTIFDRQGNVVRTVGDPGLYAQPGVSPDGTKVVVMRTDPKTSNLDIWVYDIATGKGWPITADNWPENAPIWSPDGKYVAYVQTRESFARIYRKAADGTGEPEELFKYTSGAGMVMTDWSQDGRYVTFSDSALMLVPLEGPRPAPKALDWLRTEYLVLQGRFSPDSKFMAYLSDEVLEQTFEVYVRPFDSANAAAGAGEAKPVRVSTGGVRGMIFWRQDGRELYFMTLDWEVMAVDVTTTPALQVGKPRLLFKMKGPLTGNPGQWKNVSRDGQFFVFAVNVPAPVVVSDDKRH